MVEPHVDGLRYASPMGTIRQRSNGTFELRVVHKALEKPYYTTHNNRQAAERYNDALVAALDRGDVPPELRPAGMQHAPMDRVLKLYAENVQLAYSDRPMVQFLRLQLDISIADVTVKWVDTWVARMKEEHLAPGTIRKRVECLARAVDWWYRREYASPPANPLRTLPSGYSTYKDGAVKDTRRDRRLEPGEQQRIEAAILGEKRPDRQRPLAVPHREHFLLMFRLILNTGLRLREAYRLQVRDVDLNLRTIRVRLSKTKRPRQVPLPPQYVDWIAGVQLPTDPESFLFPFWDGTEPGLRKATNKLSAQFARVFEYAQCEDLTEHDLRHEATCRWMELRDRNGNWLYRAEEVRRITGHLSVQEFERYLSLRGSDLADRLWDRG